MRLLLVEDDRDLADALAEGLEEMGYRVEVAHDGIDGETMALASAYDLLVIDWAMPRQDGRTTVRRLRQAGLDTPVLMLTAFADISHRVEGLDAGADDYLTKPFSFDELFARLRALSRRTGTRQAVSQIAVGPLRVDIRRRQASLDGNPLQLRPKEFALLEFLVERQDSVVTRTVIAEHVWGTAFGVTDDVINMTVSTLRRSLQEATPPGRAPVTIKTVRGIGYHLAIEG